MDAYRLYFRSSGSIVAREDFEAENDAAAQSIAAALFDACSDRCQMIEIWQGTRQIRPKLPRHQMRISDLSDAHQEAVVKTEEMIVQSEWNIARSRRLLDTLAAATQPRKPKDVPIETRVSKAERHVREGEERVARQIRLIRDLDRSGRNEEAAIARQLLGVLTEALDEARRFWQIEREAGS